MAELVYDWPNSSTRAGNTRLFIWLQTNLPNSFTNTPSMCPYVLVHAAVCPERFASVHRFVRAVVQQHPLTFPPVTRWIFRFIHCLHPHPTVHQADPTNIGLHEGLAALSVDSGRPAEAAACYRRCLDLAASPSPASGQVTDSVRIDRWSVALFKCHASLCDWDDWNAEARALRAAVRRRGGGEKRRSVGKEGEGGGGEEGLGEAVTVTSSPPPRLHGSDRALLLGLELLPGERQGRHAALWSNMGTEGPNDTGGGAVGKAVGETAREAPARSAKEMKTATATENGGPAESPSLITAAFEAASAEAATDAANEGDVSRPALHPFDSLSAPLSIGDCFAVAQQQSRAILAEASGTRGVKPETSERDGRPRQRRRRPLAAASSRDSRGRVRLGFVSGDLMGTHPLTHLMQAR